jgi:hypothetical protein
MPTPFFVFINHSASCSPERCSNVSAAKSGDTSAGSMFRTRSGIHTLRRCVTSVANFTRKGCVLTQLGVSSVKSSKEATIHTTVDHQIATRSSNHRLAPAATASIHMRCILDTRIQLCMDSIVTPIQAGLLTCRIQRYSRIAGWLRTDHTRYSLESVHYSTRKISA